MFLPLSFQASTASHRSRQKFGAEQRLTKTRDILRVRGTGRRVRVAPITLWIAPPSGLQPRVGIVVALHGHPAVARNKLKRQLRHIVRSEILPFATEPFDAVLSTQPAAYATSFTELKAAVTEAFKDDS